MKSSAESSRDATQSSSSAGGQSAAQSARPTESHHNNQQQQQQRQTSEMPPAPSAAALQSAAGRLELCKSQVRTSQQLASLSQLQFEPSDICASWHKMTTSSSSSNSEPQPWLWVEQLNVAHNNLTVLHDASGLQRLANLRELRVSHNQLARCEENSLAGLERLQHLDLSHNRLVALPARFLQPVRATCKRLNLSFNSISVLVPSLFDNLSQLEHLDLSHNDITSHWLSERLFQNLTSLHYLDLSFNKLTVFSSPATFQSLGQLESLSLQHNELRQVPETIQHLRYLSSLDLSQNLISDISNASYLSNCRLLFNLNLESNQLENITRDAFSDLPALKVLNLANNRIHYLDQQALDYVPDLHALRLDSNRLIDFGQAFVNLRFLLMLNISSNRISSFDYAQIPLGLQWLDLHSNRIDKLNNFYYSPAAQQQFSATLLTSSNGNNDIQQQPQQPQQSQSSAQSAGAQQDGSSIGQQWQSMLRLTTLDASHNLIRELDNTSLPESLETVQLNNNHIRTIASHTFASKSNLTRINLSHNQLTSLPFEALRLAGRAPAQSREPQLQQQLKFVDLYLANNPFACNCNMNWLSQLLLASARLTSGSSLASPALLLNSNSTELARDRSLADIQSLVASRQLARVADAHQVTCQLAFARQSHWTGASAAGWSPVQAANQLAQRQLMLPAAQSAQSQSQLLARQSELLASVHLCAYKSHCFALCYCCDFDACDCEMSCPENCSCYYDQTWSTNIVDCSATNNQRRHLQAPRQFNTQIPDKIPMDVTELYLDGLELVQLRANALIGRRNLKSLYLNSSQLYSIEPKALATQKSLRVLQLSSNQLTELRGHEFEQQLELRELYLSHNRLSSIANSTFKPLRSLQLLELNNNQLFQLDLWTNFGAVPPPPAAGQQQQQQQLALGQNPWSCQCDIVEPMLRWLELNVARLHDRKSVSCQFNRSSSLHLLPPAADSLDTSDNYPMFQLRQCLNHTVLPPVDSQRGYDREQPQATQQDDQEASSQNQQQQQQQPANDEPSRSQLNFMNPMANFHLQDPSAVPLEPKGLDGESHQFQLAPAGTFGVGQPARASLLGGSAVLAGSSFMLVALVLLLVSLVYKRRSMRTWLHSNYGLAFAGGKKSGAGGTARRRQQQLQYAGTSSAASTSSGGSSNLSQVLCRQQPGGGLLQRQLVTTPLIVSNRQAATQEAEGEDASKLFDAYLTYSKLDEQFVSDFIAPELEFGQPAYRVALHYRDLPATASDFLTDCITETASASRRIIMLISEQLLQNEWMQYEFRAAHLEAIRQMPNASRKLVLVLLGQPNFANFDPDLIHWLKSCTCLQWGEKMFWQRLRFALPEVARHAHHQVAGMGVAAAANLSLNRYQQQQQQQQQRGLAADRLGEDMEQATGTTKSSTGTGAGIGIGIGSMLLKSTGALLGIGHSRHAHQQPPLPQRPLPLARHEPEATSTSVIYERPGEPTHQQQQQQQHHHQNHHYSHLSPLTMTNVALGHAHQPIYHQQPIYGDPKQQQQHDYEQNPVHI